MFKHLKKILLFLSFFVSLIIIKEFVALYAYLKAIHEYVAYAYLIISFVGIIYFVVLPIISILKIRVSPAPTTDPPKEEWLIKKRLQLFIRNKHLKGKINFSDTTLTNRELYDSCIKILAIEADKIRKREVNKVFVRTLILQNGFLDSVIILVSHAAIIKETFKLYNGRVSNRDLLLIGKQVYYSMTIGGTELIEGGVQFMFKGLDLPFIGKITSSVTDGFVNAMLTTRVSMITENYCTKTYVKDYEELYPTAKALYGTTKIILGSVLDNMISIAGSKKIVWKNVANPVGSLLERAIDMAYPHQEEEESDMKKYMKMGGRFAGNPIAFGIEQLAARSSKKKNKTERTATNG